MSDTAPLSQPATQPALQPVVQPTPQPASQFAAGGYAHLSIRALALADFGLMVLDADQRIVLWNQWLASHSGQSAHRVLGSNLFDVFPELRGQRLEQAVHSAMHSKTPQHLAPGLNPSPLPLFPTGTWGGERIEQAVSMTPFTEGKERFCLIQVGDISNTVGRERQLRGQAEALRAQSYVDGLTGIANRRHFDVALDRELRRAQRNGGQLSLLLMDIDSFKAYNDHFGHQQGDACLTRVAGELSTMLNRSSDLLARYGGEEFAAILPDTDGPRAVLLAEAIRKGVRALNIRNGDDQGFERHITISIGVATQSCEAPLEIAALIGAADRALYLAKHAGRNRVMAQQFVAQ